VFVDFRVRLALIESFIKGGAQLESAPAASGGGRRTPSTRQFIEPCCATIDGFKHSHYSEERRQ
jgi:hypothetical protein